MVDDAATDDDEDAGAPQAKKPKACGAPAATAVPAPPAAPAASGADASYSAAIGGPKAVLIFAPGAGGTTAKDMRSNVHSELDRRCMRVYRLDDEPLGPGETRWNTAAPSSAGNLDHVIAVANRAAANPGAPLLLCGASFGNLVLAELRSPRGAAAQGDGDARLLGTR